MAPLKAKYAVAQTDWMMANAKKKIGVLDPKSLISCEQ